MSAAVGTVLDRLAPAAGGGRAERGRAWLAAHGFPTQRDESWRYSPLDDFLAVLDAAAPAHDGTEGLTRSIVDDLAGAHGGPRLVFVNGALVPGLSDLDPDIPGLWLGGAEGLQPRQRPPRAGEDEPADGFHALNWAAGSDVAAVLVDPGAEIEPPVHVVHLAVPGSDLVAVHPRTVVRAGPGSRVQVIETYTGSGGASLTNASSRIVAGDGATVRHQRVQAESLEAVHVGRTAIDQARGSTVRSTSITTGASAARNAIDVYLRGEGARAELDGLHLASGRQHHDNVVTVDHLASHCASNQRFRGIVDDHARGSFSGHVIVRPGTVATDAHQESRNLVLRPTAQADTRPWLEIFADDVRCTHGATVGRLDDEALFYLRSRGIPLPQARSMLVTAFAGEIVEGLTPASLVEHVGRRLQEVLP